jgi:uncharacterized membrane protein (UPF0127 family)
MRLDRRVVLDRTQLSPASVSREGTGTLEVATETKLIVNLTSGECLCVGVMANRPLRRMRGLIGKEALAAGEGLLLAPAPAIHTAFMRFPIDALFLDRKLRVLAIVEQLRPWRVASQRRSHAVLELSAGECARKRVQVGDRLALRERRPLAAAMSSASGEAQPAPATLPSVIWPDSLWKADEEPARPIRVLVISPDRHYRSVTSMLLSHRGCGVITTAKGSRVVELINRERADVLLIDAERSPGAVQTATAAAALQEPVGIVVVDEAASMSGQPMVLAKWGPFEELFVAIQRAADRRGSWRSNGGGG